MKKINFITILLLIVFSGFSQSKPMKWGKVSKEEIELQTVTYEPNATAVMLCSFGDLSFGSSNILIQKHFRIKILTEEGKKYANQSIIYYGELDQITGIKAQTINFDEAGKEVITKLETSDFFEEKIDADYSKLNFTFSDVKVGSIIEFKYTLNTKNITFLDAWIFQSEIPTLKSKFNAIFPANLIYTYNVFYQGDRLLKKYGATTSSEWELTNLPGLSDDDYVYNIYDYAELLQFQLAGYYTKSATNAMDGSYETKKFAVTLDKFAETIIDITGASNYLFFSSKTKDIVQNLIADCSTNSEKIIKIYTYVNSNYKWNNVYSKYTENSLTDLLDKKAGNSAEINLLLIAMLKEADFTVYPLLISEKTHGKISKDYPMISAFNNIIAVVKIGNYYQMLDATDSYRPYNLLSINDLNFYGLLLDKKEYKWLDISIPENSKQAIDIKIDISKPEIQTYNIEFKFDGYFGVEQRKNYVTKADNFLSENITNYSDFIVDSIVTENLNNLTETFKVKCYLHKNENTIFNTDIVYYQPFIFSKNSQNPFKQDKRNLPIDLAFKYSDELTMKIYFPDNYIIDEIPKTKNSKLIDNTGSFSYSAYKVDNYVKIESKISINETLFFASEYADLKTFFAEIVAKYNEPIVLKKK